MKIFTKYILPAALVAGFLFYFIYDVLHYRTTLDDCFYDGIIRKWGIGESIDLCYKILNGRWFSHIICAISFYFLQHNFTLYALYLAFLLLLFVVGVNSLYKNYCKTFLQKEISFSKSISFSFVFTAAVYFLLFEGRREIWGWVSSANNHLLSVIICLFLFSLLIKEKRNLFLIFLLAAFVGGLNEVNAMCSVLLIVGLFLLNKFYFQKIKLSKMNLFISVIAIIISLLVNINSGGYKMRMGGLPDFTWAQSIKNTMHSFLIPFIHYKFLPVILGTAFIFFLFLKEGTFKVFSRKEIIIFSSAFIIVLISFFLHCYSLSDIMPLRGELWGYTFLLFVVCIGFSKKQQ